VSPQFRVGKTYTAVSCHHIQELLMLSFLLSFVPVYLLAFAEATGFYGSSGDLNPLLPGCPAFAAADQTGFIYVLILPELHRMDEVFNLCTNRNHKLTPSLGS
jgi:hypothetical protein